MLTLSLEEVSKTLPLVLANVLLSYEDIFQEPITLPTHRGHNHQIPLKEGSNPVNLRLYSYGNLEKDIVEQMT